LSGLWCGRFCRGPVWEFADRVQITEARSKHFAPNWLSDPVSHRPLHGAAIKNGLDHDIAEVFFDADVAVEDRFHQLLVSSDILYDELEQVVVSAAYKMTFLERFVATNVGLEFYEGLTPVIMQRHFSENGDVLNQIH
jgi:hypothetical protein